MGDTGQGVRLPGAQPVLLRDESCG